MSLQLDAITGVRWTGLSAAIVAGIQALQLLLLARLLVPEDFGLMGMTLVTIGFAQAFSDLGITAAIIHRQDAGRRELSSVYWLNLAVGVGLCGLVWAAAPAVALGFDEPRLVPLVRATSFVFLIGAVGQQFETLLQKELYFSRLAGVHVSGALANLLVSATLALRGFGVWSLVAGAVADAAVRTAVLLGASPARFRPLRHFQRRDLDGFLGFGAYQMGERSINFLAERLDQVLIGAVLGARALGFYTFALQLVAYPVSRINPVVTRVAFPLFARVQREPHRLRAGYLTAVRSLAAINAPLLIGAAAAAPVAVPAVFGEQWAPAILLVQILALVSLSRSLGNPVGSLLLAVGRADLGFWWNVLLLLATPPAIWAGAQLAGAAGVAGALLGLQLLLHPLAYVWLIRPVSGLPLAAYAVAILRPLLLATVLGLPLLAVRPISGIPPLAVALALAAAAVAIYAALVRRIERETFALLRRALVGGGPARPPAGVPAITLSES